MHFVYSLTALLAVLSISRALDEDFAFDISDDVDIEESAENSKVWGIPDSVAYVGQTFHLEIPKQVFGSNMQKYEASVDGDKPLPKWLLFAKAGGIFMGVPTMRDIGTLKIVVRAMEGNEHRENEFMLTVKEEEANSQKYCPAEDITILKLIIDRDFSAINSKQRLMSLNNIAKFFGLPYSAFKLEPQVKPDDLSDSSVILAGPGNLQSKHSKSTSFIQVPVGCEGRLWANMTPIVHQLKNQARDGTISEVLGLPLLGWRVKTEMRSSSRDKRQLDGSGDDIFSSSGDGNDDYYYDNYYDYGENDGSVDGIETPSSTSKSTTILVTTTPSTTTSTTTAQTTSATSEGHPHRHHHGESKQSEEIEPTVDAAKTYDLGTASTDEPLIIEDSFEEKKVEAGIITSTPKLIVFPTTPTTKTSTTNPLEETIDYSEENYDAIDELDEDDEDETSMTITPTNEQPKTSTTEKRIGVHSETSDFDERTTPSTTTTSSTVPPTTQVIAVENITNASTTFASTTPSTSISREVSSPTVIAATEALTTASSAITLTAEEIPETTLTEERVSLTTVPLLSSAENVTTSVVTSSTTEKLTTQELTTFKQTTLRHISTTQKPTTRIVTENVFETKNFPPTLQNRLKRIAVTAGKVFSFYIPRDTFSDSEDGSNLSLEFLDSEGIPIRKDSWCQFNSDTREIYGLPLEDHISRWTYTIKATDKQNQSVTDQLEILVQHYKARRAVNHEFSLYIQIEKKWELPHLIDWPLKTLKALGMIYNSNLTDIIVRNVDYNSVPAVFIWTNDTLAKHYCPRHEIGRIFDKITVNKDGDPTHELIKAMSPELRVKKVAYRGLGVCESKPQTPHPPITPPSNFSPILRNPVDYINATLGELLIFKVPEDTFYDPEDTDQRNLRMSLLTANRQQIPTDNWLQFDSRNKEFYGIPLHKEDVGQVEYHLVCKDSGGLPASDSLIVQVLQPPQRNFNVEFTMELEVAYSMFSKSAAMQRKFVEKLVELFADRNASSIRIKSITEGTRDGEIRRTNVSWFNTSLQADICPVDEINKLETVLVQNDRTVATRVQYIMDLEFPVSSIYLDNIDACKARHSSPVVPPSVDVATDDSSAESSHDEYLVTFIVPAVIIAAMLFLAGIFACILYRRRRTGKMNVEEDGRATYGNKGIPVIFQEELEEKPESGTKAPVILKDEKPPLAPPEYSKSGSLKLNDDSEPYQPPPPVTRTQDNGRQVRPKPTPTYRKPPPYVPP